MSLTIIRPVLILIAAIWAIEVLNFLTGHSLTSWFGLEPRRLSGLIGVPAMPLLHAGFGHVAANTLPLAILAILTLVTAPRRFAAATAIIIVMGGLLTWLLARSAVHVGASGLVFGYFGFLVARGAIDRNLKTIAVAVVVVLAYGGLIWGVAPGGDPNVSWEGHLFGFAAGIAAAWVLRNRS